MNSDMPDTGLGSHKAEPTPDSVLGHEEFTERLLLMLRSARQEITIFSHDLDRRIFGHDQVVRLIREFLLAHRRGRLRAVVRSPRSAVQGSHKLVELSRVLSSRMEFREASEDSRYAGEEYVLVDQRQLLIRNAPQDLEASFYADAAGLGLTQARQFDNVWNRAQVAREFSDLRL